MKTKMSYAKEILPASTTRREEEPVHEYTRAVIVRIIGQQSVPFVLLLTTTVTGKPPGGGLAEERKYVSSKKQTMKLHSQLNTN